MVKGFAEIAALMHMLTGKGVAFQRTSPCQTAFETLKESMVGSPVMAIPTDEDMHMLDTDASDHSIGAVLS